MTYNYPKWDGLPPEDHHYRFNGKALCDKSKVTSIGGAMCEDIKDVGCSKCLRILEEKKVQ